MTKPFSSNIYDSIFKDQSFNEVVQGLKENGHLAFEFLPFCGETLFAKSLSTRLSGGGFNIFSIDLQMVAAQWHFAVEFSKALVAAFADSGKKEAMIKRLALAGPIRIERNNVGNLMPDISSRSDLPRFISTLLDIPEVVGIEENRRSVVIISGFQRMAIILGSAGEKMLYKKAGKQRATSYVITGYGISAGARKLEEKKKNRVILKQAVSLFGWEEIKNYIKGEYERANKAMTIELIDYIMELSSGRTEIALQLAETFLGAVEAGAPMTEDVLQEVIVEMLESSSNSYLALWNLNNNRQKSLLLGLSRNEENSIYSKRFITKYGFGTATDLQAALRGLNSKSIIVKDGRKWDFADPFYSLWIQRSSGSSLGG